MKRKPRSQQASRYQFESWRTDDACELATRQLDEDLTSEEQDFAGYHFSRTSRRSRPNVRDQTSVLELLGRINYKIIKGKQIYIQAGGVVYKTLYGGYWRSVFTGAEHYLFHCEQVSGAAWSRDDDSEVDLPISFSNGGWAANGHSLSFLLAADQSERTNRRQQILQKITNRWRVINSSVCGDYRVQKLTSYFRR